MSDVRSWVWLGPVALLVTGLLAAAVTWAQRGGIESDLTARSQAALTSAGLSVGQVSFDGRDAKLRGFPSGRAERQAAETVRRIDGVRAVDVSEAVPTPESPSDTPGGPSSEAPPPTDKAGLQTEIDRLLTAEPITFQLDSDSLTVEGERTIWRLAELVGKANLDAKFEVDVHITRGLGGNRAALKLAKDRARAVAQSLSANGVPTGRITSQGFGDTRFNGGRADGRRIEIKVG